MGKAIKKVFLEHGWETVLTWEYLFVNRARGLFLSVHVDDIKQAGKTENIVPTWKMLMKDADLGEPTSFIDHVYLGCTQRECQSDVRIQDFCWSQRKTTDQNFREMQKQYLFGLLTWKITQRNAWKDIANWRIRRRSNFSKSRHHACMSTHLKKNKLDQLENYPQFAHKLF